MSELALPVQVNLHPDESGLSFCLRTARANGVSLPLMFQCIGQPFPMQLHVKDAPTVAMLCGIEVSALASVLPTKVQQARVGWRYHGHFMTHRTRLRLGQPQVCPACIRQALYAKANWDLALSTACKAHTCRLIDVCPRCHQSIRWNRPALEWGHCKHLLTAASTDDQDIESLLQMQTITDLIFSHLPVPASSWASPLAAGTSLDGWFKLILAFGLLEWPGQVASSRQHTSIPNTRQAQDLLLRAHLRMLRYLSSTTDSHNGLEHEIQEAPLQSMIKDPIHSADQSIASKVYAEIFGRVALQKVLRLCKFGEQLLLFEENT